MIYDGTPLEKNYNAADISLDLICIYLKDGRRKPQNEDEEELLKEMLEIEARGNGIELNFD